MTTAEKLTAVAKNVPKVYEAGKKSEYDKFWDSFNTQNLQQMYLFAGGAWNDTTFYPKTDIILTSNGGSIFALNQCTNIKKRLQEQGVTLDLSGLTSAHQTFYYAVTSELPELNLAKCSYFTSTFAYARKLVTIDKLIVSETTTWSNVFNECYALINLILEGTIGQKGFDIHWSTLLSAESLYSIINALSTTATGLTITLPSTAEANYNANPPEGAPATWADLIATRTNWTIAYA